MMGSIPILETYNRKDSLYRTYDNLPILWDEHYDYVTPSLLEESYPKTLASAKDYEFETFTTQWWTDLINKYLR